MNVLAFATHSIHRLGLQCSFQQLMILHKPKSLDAKATSRQFMKCVSFLMSDSNDPITNYDDEWDTNNYGKVLLILHTIVLKELVVVLCNKYTDNFLIVELHISKQKRIHFNLVPKNLELRILKEPEDRGGKSIIP